VYVSPAMDDAGVLSRRDVRLATQATWEEVLTVPKLGTGQPVAYRCPGLLGNLELDRPPVFCWITMARSRT
jgi:hypothetical protein